MARIKKGVVKFWLKILSVVIGFFSLKACWPYSPATDYGTPYADYSVIGNVEASDTKQPLQGIRIQFKYNSSREAISDAAGNYQLESRCSYFRLQILEFTDINGAFNGYFITRDVTADFSAATFTGGNGGWYKGKASQITVNAELDRLP